MYIDPYKEPNKWLTAVMLDLLAQNTHKSRAMLADGIRVAVNFLEPGCIDQLFGTWVDEYVELLAEAQMQKNKIFRPYSQEGLEELHQEFESDSKCDHPDTEDDTK